MKRIEFLDLARGGTVLMMAPVHTALLYSSPTIYDTVFIKFLAFMAEGPGAQLFMTLMGIYIGLSPKQTSFKTCKRAGLLMLAGFALNAVKFVVPYFIGILPEELLNELQADTAMQLLLIGDIFHFSAIAIVVSTLVKNYLKHNAYIVVLIVVIMTIAPYCWDVESNNAIIHYLLQLLDGQPPRIFFPVFPWLVYPLAGLIIGKCLRHDERSTMEQVVIFSMLMLGIYYSYRITNPATGIINFYRTEWPETIQHISIVGFTLFIYYKLQQYIPENMVFEFLRYSGQNITRLYVTQWILVMVFLPVAGYQQAYMVKTIIWIIIITSMSYLITWKESSTTS